MRRQAHTIDRPTFLRAIAQLNRFENASASRIAAALRIPQEDARELAIGEVQAGYLKQHTVTHEHRYIAYRLTSKGESEIGPVAV